MKECKKCKHLIFAQDRYRCREIRKVMINSFVDVIIGDLTFYCKFWEGKI